MLRFADVYRRVGARQALCRFLADAASRCYVQEAAGGGWVVSTSSPWGRLQAWRRCCVLSRLGGGRRVRWHARCVGVRADRAEAGGANCKLQTVGGQEQRGGSRGEAKNGSACGWRVGAKECCWRRSSITFVARFVVRQIYVWLGCSHRPRAAFSPRRRSRVVATRPSQRRRSFAGYPPSIPPLAPSPVPASQSPAITRHH